MPRKFPNSQSYPILRSRGRGRGGQAYQTFKGGKEGGGEGEKSRAKSTLDLLSPPAKSFGYFQRHLLITQCRGKHFEEGHFITIHENTFNSHSCASWSKIGVNVNVKLGEGQRKVSNVSVKSVQLFSILGVHADLTCHGGKA